jgi:hypothetical protein
MNVKFSEDKMAPSSVTEGRSRVGATEYPSSSLIVRTSWAPPTVATLREHASETLAVWFSC